MSLIQATLVYGAASAAASAVPFLLLPLLTRWLDPAGYGLIGIAFSLVGVFSSVVGLNLHSLVTRRYFTNPAEMGRLIGNSLLILAASAIMVACLALSMAPIISSHIGIPTIWLLAILAIASSQFITNLLLALLQAEGRPILFGSLQIGLAVVSGGAAVLFIGGLGWNWEGRVLGHLAATLITTIVSLTILARRGMIELRPDPALLRELLRYGLPLIPYVLSAWMLMAFDRTLIAGLSGPATAGIYFAAVQLGQGMLLVQDAVNKAWVPWLYKHLAAPTVPGGLTVVRTAWRLAIGYLLLAMLLGLAAPWLVSVALGAPYADAALPLGLICFGYALDGIYKLVINTLFFHEKTGLLCLVTLAGAAVTISVDVLTIPVFGASGAALGLVAGVLTSLLAGYTIAQRIAPLPLLVLTPRRC